MSERDPNYSARSSSIGVVGRSLNTIRQHHIIIDRPTVNEEINSAEAFLVGLSSCGVTLIERAASEMGIGLDRVQVGIDGYRESDVAAFERIEMRFELMGPSEEEAALLVGRYRDG